MKTVLLSVLLTLGPGMLIAGVQPQDQMIFPVDSFATETRVVQTSGGQKKVTYHSYIHIPYVAKPVDKDYQSLDVYIPVEINGRMIDTKNAPVFFDIKVGGYMSVRNIGDSRNSGLNRRSELALAAGYVIVTPGCRGRDNKSPDGVFYGKAPAAIVDLKAAVRYIRHNDAVMPGNSEMIFSAGCSAGGALSALLGTSGNSSLFEPYLKEIGAANERDDIYGSICYSPITDLEHADAAYEWMYGALPARSGPVDQALSEKLRKDFSEYQKSLNLKGKEDFGVITADNYDEYLLKYYLIPSAQKYLDGLSESARAEYLSNNSWIKSNPNGPSFTFTDYARHAGRMKGLPAFDDFSMKQPEPDLFGNAKTPARHFTAFSLRYSSGDENANLDDEVARTVNMMNAMYFIGKKNEACAQKWWLRNGTKDNHTSQTVMINLAEALEQMNRDVNTWLFWDGGHCADDDPEGLVNWIGSMAKVK